MEALFVNMKTPSARLTTAAAAAILATHGRCRNRNRNRHNNGDHGGYRWRMLPRSHPLSVALGELFGVRPDGGNIVAHDVYDYDPSCRVVSEFVENIIAVVDADADAGGGGSSFVLLQLRIDNRDFELSPDAIMLRGTAGGDFVDADARVLCSAASMLELADRCIGAAAGISGACFWRLERELALAKRGRNGSDDDALDPELIASFVEGSRETVRLCRSARGG